MKSRWTTFLLLTFVLIVWGVVAWKILFPTSPAEPAVREETSARAVSPGNRDTLLCDYPDPFAEDDVAARPRAKTHSAGDIPRLRRGKAKLVHLGTIAAAGKTLYILTVGGQQYELHRGETAEGFCLNSVRDDSLYFSKDQVVYAVKSCD